MGTGCKTTNSLGTWEGGEYLCPHNISGFNLLIFFLFLLTSVLWAIFCRFMMHVQNYVHLSSSSRMQGSDVDSGLVKCLQATCDIYILIILAELLLSFCVIPRFLPSTCGRSLKCNCSLIEL